MKYNSKLIFALLAFAFLTSVSVQAEIHEKILIAFDTDDVELAETDISTLAIGEALTIESQSGKLIDIIRTAEGAEIYVDGELLEMNFHDAELHEGHMMNKHVEIVCDDDEECDNNVSIIAGDEHKSTDGHKVIVIKKVQTTEY